MAAAKKKPKIQASDVEVSSRRLEAVLIDLAEQIKVNDARCAERTTRVEERMARAEERMARAEEMAAIALQTIASVSQDLRAFTQEMRAFTGRTNDRLDALEKPTAAE
jgi:hypothetical protein